MDADIAAGTRSDAQAVAFLQRRAIPKRLHQATPSDLVKFPTSTVQQVIQRLLTTDKVLVDVGVPASAVHVQEIRSHDSRYISVRPHVEL